MADGNMPRLKKRMFEMATPKLISFACVAASLLAISTPAMAQVHSVEIKYQDLDLTSARGQERLKTRITQAAKRVCARPLAITLEDRLDHQNCEKNAAARAMPKAEQQITAHMANRRMAANR
jgi:UrcA family protein